MATSFIEVTAAGESGAFPTLRVIATAHVEQVYMDRDRTVILLNSDNSIVVKETYEQVKRLLGL